MEGKPEESTCGQHIGLEVLEQLKIANLLYIITAVSSGYWIGCTPVNYNVQNLLQIKPFIVQGNLQVLSGSQGFFYS